MYPTNFNNFMTSIYNKYFKTYKINNSDIESNTLFEPPTPHKRSYTLSESDWEEIV